MAKAPDGPAPISQDSIAYLEEVKKGKPRKFAMICKGADVVSLVVYKKGEVEKYRKEAKQSGKGQFYFGLVDGKGVDFRFALAREDGFESAPVKSTALRGFLDEAAGLKCRPFFEIVDASPLALDPEDPLVARFLKLQEPALNACDARPDQAPGINALCLKIGKLLDQEKSDEAVVEIEQLEFLLRSLSGGNPYEELVKGLLSTLPGDIQRLRASDPAAADKIQKVVDAGRGYAQKGDFQNAYKFLEEASRVLAKVLTASRNEQAVGAIPEGIVAARKAALTKAQSRWDAALVAARKRLKPVQVSVESVYPSLAQGLKNILDSYEKDLRQELEKGQSKAQEEELSVAVRETIAKVESLRIEAEADAVFAYLEECNVPVRAALAEALDDVQEILLS